ncbi:DUF3093 domain-containing protein [Nocardioides psychrotolerans]|uniref:DUF3093 domain-containing protein n=1 Tax=Nocardioides psychrotolerans TaxID=1005945 RepID=UPI003137C325
MASIPAFRERLRVPLRWWALGSLMVSTFWLAMVVAIPPAVAWGISVFVMLVLAMGLTVYGSARIVVDDDQLQAGRANIGMHFIGDVLALDAEATRQLSGPIADARAFLVLRPYIRCAVRIDINDPQDPTPYWLISTRRAAELADALDQIRPSTQR